MSMNDTFAHRRCLLTIKAMAALLYAVLTMAAVLPASAQAATARVSRNDTLAQCSWDRPGRNPFTGDVVLAVDRYTDIPTEVRNKLKQRMQAREYDDLVDIRRDSVSGKFQYASQIRDMHFGDGRVCRQVTRARWSAKNHERGLVYCESEHCILVPTVCRNVSRVDRKPSLVAAAMLTPPPDTTPADPVADDGRARAAGAEAPGAADQAPAPRAELTPAAPITSSFSEAVAGAVVPLLGPLDDMPPTGAGAPVGLLPFGGTLPPALFTPGGGGVAPIGGGPGGSGGGGGGGAGGGTGGNPGSPGGGVDGGGGGTDGGNDPPSPPDGGGGVIVIPGDPGSGGGGGGGGNGGGQDPGTPDGGGGGGGVVVVDPGLTPVTPVPEPSTWASLISGLLLLSWLVRRQRRAPAGTPKCATQKRS